ncbi:MAG TPA: ABC transporter permease, partial [Micromonosporaceae bacterium]
MLDVILSGLVSASLYAIAGLGLGVVYRATKVLNFAMGGFGALATYAAYNLIGHGAPYWLVFVTAIAVGAAIGGLAELGVNRRLARLSPLTITMGSLGLLLVLEGAVGTWYDYSTRALPPMLGSETALRIGSSSLSANQVAIIVVAVIVAVALALLTNRTRYGLAMRAVSSGPHTSELLGVDVTRVRLGAWVLGGVCGAIAAMLVTPLTYLSPGSFASFMLSAFTAAVLGGFNRIRGLIVGALVFGVGLNLLESYLSTRLTNTYMFVVIALVLLIRPSGVFGGREREVTEVASAQAAPAPARELPVARRASTIRGAGWVLVGVAFVVCPYVLAEPHVYLLALALSTFIAVAGLNVITGYTGQVSVGHSGFLAVGAYAAAVAGSHASVPIGLLLPIALVAGAVVGVVVGLPATRLRGVYLALFTLVFSFMVPELVLWFGRYTGGPNGLALSPPAFAYGVRGLYWFTLAIATAVALILMVAQRGRIGRGWRAVRDSEDGARAAGIGPTTVKVAAFAFGSALAGLSGALSGMQVGIVSPQGYDVLISIYMLLAVILGGSSSIFGSLLGALFITL